jgi:hypothetical protein
MPADTIPLKVYNWLNTVSALDPVEVSPFVRNHDGGFPAVVYSFAGDTFPSATNERPGPRLVRWQAMSLARTITESEQLGEAIIDAAQTNQSGCPMRVVGVNREYEPAYDGGRSGIYINIVELEFFA